MSLITQANLLSFCDKIGAAYAALKTGVGTTAVPGTATPRGRAQALFDLIVTAVDDYEQEVDLGTVVNTSRNATEALALAAALFPGPVRNLVTHVRVRGTGLTLSSQLAAWNNAVPWSALLSPEFGEVFAAVSGAALPAAAVYSPAINPTNGASGGMGTRTDSVAFTDGADVVTATYSPVNLLGVLTTNLAGGSDGGTLTVTGTDNTNASMTWTGTFGSGGTPNPASAVSTTITPAITTPGRQTVALGSVDGIAAGQWLEIDTAGTTAAETVLVEAVVSSTITAVFQKAHLAGAAAVGVRSVLLTPATANRRAKSLSAITFTGGSHTTWAFRIDGVQDRVNF